MRTFGLITLLGLTACAGPGVGNAGNVAGTTSDSAASGQPAPLTAPPTSVGRPFAGAWASCDGAPSQDQCSRYLLMQRGDRICGTWSYFASGQEFEGRLVAHGVSGTTARRTHVCGRPGSETDTECADGWQQIDKPLELCGDKLSDMTGADGACFADYEAVPASKAELAALASQSWLQTCLATDP